MVSKGESCWELDAFGGYEWFLRVNLAGSWMHLGLSVVSKGESCWELDAFGGYEWFLRVNLAGSWMHLGVMSGF